jgi:hypothetical protein
MSINPRSLSPLPSPFLQPAAVVSPRLIRSAPSTAVSGFFRDLLSRPPTRVPTTMSGHQTPAPGSSATPIVNISAQDLINLIGSMVTLISALTTSVQALVNAQANNSNASPSASGSYSIVKKPVVFKGKDSESAHLFRSAFYVWINANEDCFALHNP